MEKTHEGTDDLGRKGQTLSRKISCAAAGGKRDRIAPEFAGGSLGRQRHKKMEN